MKVALLGKGKTGSYVIELIKNKHPEIELDIFDSKRNPSLEDLKNCDVAISFLTGDVFSQYIDILIASGICVITGSTGFEFTDSQLNSINKGNSAWIHANNFSLGMNLIKEMINVLKRAPILFDEFSTSIHEVHHTKKLDAPSGTAKAWKEWLTFDSTKVTSERIGDVIGLHTLELSAPNEKITLTHEALDRSIFADGAIWALKEVSHLEPGLHDFSKIALKKLMEE